MRKTKILSSLRAVQSIYMSRERQGKSIAVSFPHTVLIVFLLALPRRSTVGNKVVTPFCYIILLNINLCARRYNGKAQQHV